MCLSMKERGNMLKYNATWKSEKRELDLTLTCSGGPDWKIWAALFVQRVKNHQWSFRWSAALWFVQSLALWPIGLIFNFWEKKEIPFHSCPLAPSLLQTRTSGSDCQKHHTGRAFYVQSQDHTRRDYVHMYLFNWLKFI